ncbi:MAG TPA: hypothetical protein VJ739_05875 [Gemmataceae bacterium]|nr:hypothetical protein [Gemmataceae bacterium]
MLNSVVSTFTFLRAKWRRTHGRCRLCNRNLYALLPPSTAGSPVCPSCKDITTADMRMGVWGGLADFPAEADLSGEFARRLVGLDQ